MVKAFPLMVHTLWYIHYAGVPQSGKRLPIPPIIVFWDIRNIPVVEGRAWENFLIYPVIHLYHKTHNLINDNAKPNHIGLDRNNPPPGYEVPI